ncbi:hypothetical protein JCM11251_006545 [Rhodosporidiobolus azoricus]
MFSSITSAFGYYTTPSASSSGSAAVDSVVAEPDTTSVAFPALHSQQRAKGSSTSAAATSAPTFSLDPPATTSPDEDEEPLELPDVEVDGQGPRRTAKSPGGENALAPPPSTVKVVKAPKGRVRVEKGFSQLDWAKLNRSGEVDLRGGVTELRRITPAEMALHNTKEDCWQAYGGKVYNVGPFLRYHPGGGAEMMRGAGKDVLAHAWVNYDALLENCLVGFLVRE